VRPSFWAVILLLGVAEAAGSADPTEPLFILQRSRDANEVHYDARLSADGQLDEKDPIDAYWLRKAEDGSRKPLSKIMLIAYGFEVKAPREGRYPFKLKCFSLRTTTLVRTGGHWRVETTISGQTAFLNRLFVTTDESGTFPKVLSIDLFGEDAGGKPLHEHLPL